MTVYLVQASPLTRIFIKEWQNRCLDDPKLLLSTEKFLVKIPRACGGIELTHGVPILASSLLPPQKTREVTDDEVAPLVRWLTSPREEETDCYGVVDVPIEENVADAIMALIHEADDNKRLKFIEETRRNMAKGIKEARDRADQRVLRACGRMYSIVKRTYDDMKKNNTGVYMPSYSEALALTVMQETIKERRQPDERAQEIMKSAMQQMEQHL